jgi:hypothetical protein
LTPLINVSGKRAPARSQGRRPSISITWRHLEDTKQTTNTKKVEQECFVRLGINKTHFTTDKTVQHLQSAQFMESRRRLLASLHGINIDNCLLTSR